MFWPDTGSVEKALAEYVASLARREEVREVFVCGSWAKGTYTAASDVDLLVLIRDGSTQARQRPRDRVPAYLPGDFPVSLDLFVYTEGEAKNSPFARHLLQTGRKLGPGPSGSRGSSP